MNKVCICHDSEKHGQTSVMCCNRCGLPDEEFWQPSPTEIGQQGVEGKEELLADWRNGKYPDFSGLSPKEKADFIYGLIQIAAKEIMMCFYACGLKTHIECEVINDPTNERFKFSFTKLSASQPAPPQEGQDELWGDVMKIIFPVRPVRGLNTDNALDKLKSKFTLIKK